MKKGLHLTIAVALISGLALVLCGSGCDEDGNANGGAQVRSLEEARAIAEPIANTWNPDSFNWFATGAWVDDEGLLLPPGDSVLHFWQFRYHIIGNLDYVITVFYDGTHNEFEQSMDDMPGLDGIPSYSDDHVKFLMAIATPELIDYLGAGDYMFTITLQDMAYDDPNAALITAYDKYVYGPGLAWIILDADTGEVIERSWD